MTCTISVEHDDVIKCKHFPRYLPFVRGIHRSHKGQWRGALMLSLICAWINVWVNNRETGDLRRHRAHYDVIVMMTHGNIHWKPGSCDDNLRYPKRKRLAAWQLLVFSVLVSCGLKLWLYRYMYKPIGDKDPTRSWPHSLTPKLWHGTDINYMVWYLWPDGTCDFSCVYYHNDVT